MNTLLLIAGIAIVIGTVYLLVKRKEARLVLFGAGLLMAFVAGKPMSALEAFTEKMIMGDLLISILSVMGFAFVLKFTGCDKELINLSAGFLKKTGVLLIPFTVLATFLINIALPSAAGTAAAVGAIFIPILIGAGVHPAMAGAAVLGGTFGSNLNPGGHHNAFVGEIAQLTPMEVVEVLSPAVLAAGTLSGLCLFAIAFLAKEYKGHNANAAKAADHAKPKVLHAMVPVVPLLILILGSTVLPQIKMNVGQAMIIGAIVAVLITRANPTKLVDSYFGGMGKAYSDIMGIIIAAGVFVSGMNSIGLVDKFIESMINSPEIVNLAAAFGPFLLGVVSGSGDAAAFAFNEAVTPSAAKFGAESVNMGSLAALAGSLGRSMSPIAGAAIICAGIAQVEPMALVKRTAPGMILAAVSAMIILL